MECDCCRDLMTCWWRNGWLFILLDDKSFWISFGVIRLSLHDEFLIYRDVFIRDTWVFAKNASKLVALVITPPPNQCGNYYCYVIIIAMYCVSNRPWCISFCRHLSTKRWRAPIIWTRRLHGVCNGYNWSGRVLLQHYNRYPALPSAIYLTSLYWTSVSRKSLIQVFVYLGSCWC